MLVKSSISFFGKREDFIKGTFGKHPHRGFLSFFYDTVENPRLDPRRKALNGCEDSPFPNISGVRHTPSDQLNPRARGFAKLQ